MEDSNRNIDIAQILNQWQIEPMSADLEDKIVNKFIEEKDSLKSSEFEFEQILVIHPLKLGLSLVSAMLLGVLVGSQEQSLYFTSELAGHGILTGGGLY
jgi:F0F1-type ATP synthase assembly protein I